MEMVFKTNERLPSWITQYSEYSTELNFSQNAINGGGNFNMGKLKIDIGVEMRIPYIESDDDFWLKNQ